MAVLGLGHTSLNTGAEKKEPPSTALRDAGSGLRGIGYEASRSPSALHSPAVLSLQGGHGSWNSSSPRQS